MKRVKFVVTVFLLFLFAGGNAQWNNSFVFRKDIKSLCFIDANTGWGAGRFLSVVRTTDGGNNWSQLESGAHFNANFNSINFFDSQTGVMVGDAYQNNLSIFKTTNGGDNWYETVEPAGNYRLTDVIFTPVDHIALACGFDSLSNLGIILRSTDLGNTWVTCYNGLGKIRRLMMSSQATGFAGGEILLRTVNKGINWVTVTSSYNVNDVFFLSNNTDGWIGTENGKIFASNDGGTTWHLQLNNFNVPIKSLFFTNSTTGWASTITGRIYKTTNAGYHWSKQITGLNSGVTDIYMPTNNVGYASTLTDSVTRLGIILKTVNGGGPFIRVTETYRRGNLYKPILPLLTTLDTIYIPPRPLEDNFTIIDVNVIIDTVINVIDSSLVFMMVHENVYDTIIFRAGQTGNNFIGTILDDEAVMPIENGTAPFTGSFRPSRPLSQLNNTPISGKWILSIYHQGTAEALNPLLTGVIKSWATVITYNNAIPDPMGIGIVSGPLPSKFKLYQNYPNPFNPATNIKFDIPDNSFVNVTIYDITGREVSNLINERLSAGSYEIPWNAADYASGIYFYRLNTDRFSDTKKMILIK